MARFDLRTAIALFTLLWCVPAFTRADELAANATIEAEHGLVVSAQRDASAIGVDALKRGGTAVDAAVATAFALAVTHPEAGNIGGGGFMLIFPGDGRPPVCIDYRETAPAASTERMFAPDDGRFTCKMVGVPGTVRGLELAHREFGKLPWRELVMPSAELAEQGFVVDPYLAESLNELIKESSEFPELLRVYGKDGGKSPWATGDRLVLPELAKTLRAIAEQGPNAFYTGAIADQLVAEMQAGKGLITRDDLAAYQAKRREPIHGTYRGYDIYGPPPPSSGGVCLVEMLNILEPLELRRHGRNSSEAMHFTIEAMKRAYCDRARYLGDPDFNEIPAHVTEKTYAQELSAKIAPWSATPSDQLAPEIALSPEGNHTTHFSVLDEHGMAVANTYTLEESYGARIVVRGAGFLLNNEMGDFNWQPGRHDRHRGERDRAGQTHAQLAVPRGCRARRSRGTRDGEPRRADDHQHGAARRARRAGVRAGRARSGRCAALSPPMASGCGHVRAERRRRLPRGDSTPEADGAQGKADRRAGVGAQHSDRSGDGEENRRGGRAADRGSRRVLRGKCRVMKSVIERNSSLRVHHFFPRAAKIAFTSSSGTGCFSQSSSAQTALPRQIAC